MGRNINWYFEQKASISFLHINPLAQIKFIYRNTISRSPLSISPFQRVFTQNPPFLANGVPFAFQTNKNYYVSSETRADKHRKSITSLHVVRNCRNTWREVSWAPWICPESTDARRTCCTPGKWKLTVRFSGMVFEMVGDNCWKKILFRLHVVLEIICVLSQPEVVTQIVQKKQIL